MFILAGLSLLTRPLAGVITLTIILAAYLLAGGILRIMLALGYRSDTSRRLGLGAVQRPGRHRARRSSSSPGMPGTATWVLGLLVGINLLMMGVAILMVAFAVRKAAPAAA